MFSNEDKQASEKTKESSKLKKLNKIPVFDPSTSLDMDEDNKNSLVTIYKN